MKLSIVIPAYNEEFRLPKTLREYSAYFAEKFGNEMEIIVVANHCSDDTVGVAEKIAQEWSQIKVLNEPGKTGKGGAVELGMKQARGSLIGFVDADGATPPESFFKMFENIEDYGCIIGSRWIEGAQVYPRQSWMRRAASRILNKIFVQGLFGVPVRDSQCGAKLFKAEVIQNILPEAVEPGWAFDIDLLCRTKRAGYRIREFPIKWHHVPGNPTRFFVMGLQMLASIWRVKRALNC
ncbi:glycosyltransferase family 2 protein [Verrucomicrobia bacterium S94]|nr:glycosyltransferase family 2 protein [Verrucomicrobia bacterium S94]